MSFATVHASSAARRADEPHSRQRRRCALNSPSVLALIFLHCVARLSLAASPDLESRAESDGAVALVRAERESITIAQSLRVSILLETPPGEDGVLPEFGDSLGPWHVLSAAPRELTRASRGGVLRGADLVLEPFLPGDYEIPALEFRIRSSAPGAERAERTLRTTPITVRVESVLEDPEKASIAPQRGMIESAPAQSGVWWALGLAGGVLLLAAGGAAVMRRRLRVGKAPMPPAWKIARLELERLLARMVWSPEEATRALDHAAHVLAGWRSLARNAEAARVETAFPEVRARLEAFPRVKRELDELRFSGAEPDPHAARRLGEEVMRITAPTDSLADPAEEGET